MGTYTTWYYKEDTGTWIDLVSYFVGAYNMIGLPIVWDDNESTKGAEAITRSDGGSAIVVPENTFYKDTYDLGILPLATKIVLDDLVQNGIILKYTTINSETKYIVMTDITKKQVFKDDEIQYRISVSVVEVDNPV